MKKKLAAALLAALLLCATLLTACGAPEFVFSKENILNHLDVSKLAYSGLELKYKETALPTDEDVEKHIDELLKANATAVDGKKDIKNEPIEANDKVKCYYIATNAKGDVVTKFTNVNKDMFNFTSKILTSSKVNEFAVNNQSDAIWKLVADKLLGVTPEEYSFELKTADYTVAANDAGKYTDIIFVQYVRTENAGADDQVKGSTQNVMIDLSTLERGDSTVGDMILDVLEGKEGETVAAVGKAFTIKVTEENKDTKQEVEASYSIEIRGAVKRTAFDFEITVPEDYSDETLAGEVLKFEFYPLSTTHYTVPTLTAKFIKDTVHFKTEKTDEAEIIAEYKASVMEDKKEAAETANTKAKYEALNIAIYESVSMKNYPQDYINAWKKEAYDNTGANYTYMLNMYAALGMQEYFLKTNPTAEAYIMNQYGAENEAELDAELEKLAKEALTEKMAFYYIVAVEGYSMTDEEYDNEIKARVEKLEADRYESARLQMEAARDKATTQAEKNEITIADYYSEMTVQDYYDSYGKDAMRASVLWDYVFEQLAAKNTFVVDAEEEN